MDPAINYHAASHGPAAVEAVSDTEVHGDVEED
jgi:hypothetical protein